jgi:hypothetical protein
MAFAYYKYTLIDMQLHNMYVSVRGEASFSQGLVVSFFDGEGLASFSQY